VIRENPTALVKLRSAWDRRIVMSNCFKLRNYASLVSIAPDEPTDVRRKRVFERMRIKAERDGKTVAVDNGVLMTDNIRVYSLHDGPVRNGQ